MAISIDWRTRVISVPRADMPIKQTSPYEIRELELDSFRRELKALEDDPEGMPFLATPVHQAPFQIGSTTLPRVIGLINGYTVTFEDGQYAVDLSGANTNLVDVLNLNQVQVRPNNSAGLANPSLLSEERQWLRRLYISHYGERERAGAVTTLHETDGTTYTFTHTDTSISPLFDIDQ